MSSISAGMRQLHRLRIKLREISDQLERGPRKIAARKQLIEKKKEEIEAQRNKLKQMKLAADQKNLQLKSSEGRIYDLSGKLNAAASNREYEALRSQIAADTMAKSVLEDEILEALDKVDVIQMEIKNAESDITTIESELQTLVQEVNSKEAGLKEQAAALEVEIAQAEEILPPDIVPQYRRLVQAYGADALAPVVNKSCSECYVSLTAQVYLELRAGRVRFCTCGRLMYVAEEE
ncbi:zinc ribbon domain-containing protein [Schlesneria sp. DSM 10557]|uniref:zinc ribbon domain-containing protein n=1 Tax=Schlesneria sp. DSM 10557 TaxID=3044399 RepID=UPI00359FA1D0